MKNDFSEWMTVKEKIHETGAIAKFSEGQIWWAALVLNLTVALGMQSLISETNKNMQFCHRYE